MFNLLICEDEPVILLGLEKLIRGFDLPVGEIYLANNSDEALQAFSQHLISLVVTDIQIPGCNGLELLEKLRKIREDFQAVIISGYNDFEYAQTAIHLGIQEYLLKPVEPSELKATLERCIDNLHSHVSQERILSGILLDQMQDIWGNNLGEETRSQLLRAAKGFFKGQTFGFLSFHSTVRYSFETIPNQLTAFFQARFSQWLAIPRFPNFFCIILNLSEEEINRYQELPSPLDNYLSERWPQGTLTCGVSSKVESLFHVKEAALQAEQALCQRLKPLAATRCFVGGKSRKSCKKNILIF